MQDVLRLVSLMLPRLTAQQAAMHDKNGRYFSALSWLYLLLKRYTCILYLYTKKNKRKEKKEVVYCYMSAKVDVERKHFLVMFFPSGFPKTVNTLKTPKQGPFISVVLYNMELHYI